MRFATAWVARMTWTSHVTAHQSSPLYGVLHRCHYNPHTVPLGLLATALWVARWLSGGKREILPPTHTRLMALCPGLPSWAGTRKEKPIWILLKQETVSGSGIRWAICKSAPRSSQITVPVPHHSVFYRPGALPAAQPTASKHRRH